MQMKYVTTIHDKANSILHYLRLILISKRNLLPIEVLKPGMVFLVIKSAESIFNFKTKINCL